MNRLRFVSLVLTALLLAGSAGGAVASQSPTSLVVDATLTGMVGVSLPFTATLRTGTSGLTSQPVELLVDGAGWVTANTSTGGVLARSYRFTTPGDHTISARYAGSTSYAPAEGNVVTVSIDPAPTVTLTVDPSPVDLWATERTTITATVTPATGGFVRWTANTTGPNDFSVTPVDEAGRATFLTGRNSYYGEDWSFVECWGKTYYAQWSPDGDGSAAAASIFVPVRWPVDLGVAVGPGPYGTAIVAGSTATVSITANPRPCGYDPEPRTFDGTYTMFDTVNGVRSEIGTVSTAASEFGKKFVAGDHVLELVYPGNEGFGPATATTAFTVLPDGSVDAGDFTISRSTFYPHRDGYRDTVAIRGVRGEVITVTARVYDSSGHRVRTLSATGALGPYSITWNGRRSDGTLVRAGRYRITQTLRDAAGHSLVVTKYVTVSAKRLYWYSRTLTKTGDAYCCTQVDGGDLSERDSAYDRGVLVDGNQYGDSAILGWSFYLEPGTKYGQLTFRVLGRSPGGRGTVKVFFNRFEPSDWGPITTAGRRYGWYANTVSPDGYYSSRLRVIGMMYAQGSNLGAFDVAKVQLVYKFALLR